MSVNPNNRDKALAAWGTDCPAWVLLLADACDRTNQKLAAAKIGMSGGVVSRVVNRIYPGDLPEVEQRVRAAYAEEGVICPLYGQMPLRTCIRHRRRENPANWMQVQLAGACPDCPNNTDRTPEED